MVWKIHILTNIFLSPTSLNKPSVATFMHLSHLWSLRWKSRANYNSKPCFAFLCNCAMLSRLSFLNSLITRAPPSGSWCRYPVLENGSLEKKNMEAVSSGFLTFHVSFKQLDLRPRRLLEENPTPADVAIYFWYKLNVFITIGCLCVSFYYLSAWVGCWPSVSIKRINYNF